MSTLRAAITSSPGASTLRAGLIYRAIPASVAPNRFYSRLRPGQPTSSVCARLSRRRRFFAVSTSRAANTPSPGASTLRAGLICRAVPALALRSIRYCVPWQVPHPPRDLWRRRATRRCTPGPSRPRRPPLGAVRRTEPFLRPAAPRAAALPAFVHAFPSPTVISPARHFLRCLR